MKKRLIVVIVAILVIVTGTIAYANRDKIFITKEKIEGNITAIDGNLIKEPTIKDKQEIGNSYDPKSGKYSKGYEVSAINKDKDLKQKKLNLITEDETADIDIDYIMNADDVVVLPSYTERINAIITKNPKIKNQFIIQYKGMLYDADLLNNKFTPLLKDQVGKYDRKLLKEEDKKDNIVNLSWGENVHFNNEGTKIAFITNRASIADPYIGNEIWVKDLKTGDEKSLGSYGYEMIGWSGDDLVVRDKDDSVVKINVSTGKSTKVNDQILNDVVLVDQSICYVNNATLVMKNIDDGSVKEYKSSTNNQFGQLYMYQSSPNNNCLAFVNQPDIYESFCLMELMDIATGDLKEINNPDNFSLLSYSWIDNSNLLLNGMENGQECSYIISIE